MPKGVLQMVALGLEDVVVFVFDLPASPARLRHRRDVVSSQAMIGDKAVVIELFTCGGIDARELEPIDRHGIVTPSQQHSIDVPIPHHFRETTIPTTMFK